MGNNVFKRIEKKYLLSEEVKNKFFESIRDYLEEDKYSPSTILNIYFDNEDNDLIIKSLEKPVFKSKVRLRNYFVPKMEDDVFFEIKCKYNGVVEKRRIKIKLKYFYDYLENKKYVNEQIMKEINYYFKYYKLKPVIFVGYDRRSYFAKNNSDLRITFDSNLRSRRDNLRLELGDYGENYFQEKNYIMEIKSLNSMPLWLARALSVLKIYPITMSKYGSIYEREVKSC